MRLNRHFESLAWREHQRAFAKGNSERVARRALRQEPVVVIVEIEVDEFAGDF